VAWREGTLPDSPLQLPPRTTLTGKYLLGKMLGQGGFGITYLAWDLNLEQRRAIKEYFPREVCGRGRDSRTVQPFTERKREAYEYGLAKFLPEGQILARFSGHPEIVSLLEPFRENGTAYIVMVYLEGQTLEQFLEEQRGRISFDEARSILLLVTEALTEVHREGLLHPDIKPANVYVTPR
jgi:serine/threonine protein kinase